MNAKEIAALRDNPASAYTQLSQLLNDPAKRARYFPNAQKSGLHWDIPEAEGIAWAMGQDVWLPVAQAAKAKGMTRQRLGQLLKDAAFANAHFPRRRMFGTRWYLWHEDVQRWVKGE